MLKQRKIASTWPHHHMDVSSKKLPWWKFIAVKTVGLWETRTKVKQHLSLTPFPDLASLFLSQVLHLLLCGQSWQNREWGLVSAAVCCSSLLICSACSNMGPAHRQQSFRKCPTIVSRGITALLWSPPEAAEEYLLQCLEHFLFLLFWSWCPQCSFSHISPHLSLPHSVFPFLKCVYPEVPPPWLGTVGLSCTLQWACWSCLELAASSMGQLQPSLTDASSAAPYYRHWTPAPNTNNK